jgi:hypothetical protein
VKSIEQEASNFRRLDDDWVARVEEVRQLEGFQDFLRPKRFSTLQTATANGPIVILNTGKSGSDALIMTSSSVKHIPLPYMGTAKIYHLVQLTRAASRGILSEADHTVINGFIQQVDGVSDTLRFLTMRDDNRHIGRTSGAAIHPDDIFRFVLAELWLSVAKPVIHSLNLEVSYLSFQKVLTLTTLFRNVKPCQLCGGAPQGHLLSSQYMQLVFTTLKQPKAFLITSFRRIHPLSVPSLPQCLFPPVLSR